MIRRPTVAYYAPWKLEQMKAKLLQEVSWFSKPNVKHRGVVFNIRQERSYGGSHLVGGDRIEVYDIWTSDGQKAECCFLDIQHRRELTIEELLTYSHDGLRDLGRRLQKYPSLLQRLYDKREDYIKIYTLITSIFKGLDNETQQTERETSSAT